jgi:hypothetical protein
MKGFQEENGMRPAIKKYNTAYKKKVDVEKDMYLPKLSPKEIIKCAGCGSFYHRRHWSLARPAGFEEPVHTHPVFCPACLKIRHHFPGGELELRGFGAEDRGEIARILRNEEMRAREKNPLERIMRLYETSAGWKVDTTTEKLAQRLGRSIKSARGGKVAFKWGHNNKFVRVVWENTAAQSKPAR